MHSMYVQLGTSHETCLRGFGRNGSITCTSAVSHVGRTLYAFKVTMKLQTFLIQMVVISCISVQYLWKYGFAKSSNNLYAPCTLAFSISMACSTLILVSSTLCNRVGQGSYVRFESRKLGRNLGKSHEIIKESLIRWPLIPFSQSVFALEHLLKSCSVSALWACKWTEYYFLTGKLHEPHCGTHTT